MNTHPVVSIYIATYNHEKYIIQALDSVRMQKTKYSYEVLVGEDVSTDNTRNLLKEYEERYPGFMQVFYRDHNMNKENPNNATDLVMRCRGKYIIALEGDDYWIDPLKIEKQVDFLEKNDDYLAVAHKCVVVDENSNQKNETYPQCNDDEYTLRHFASQIMPGQLTTVMCRNYYIQPLFDTSFVQSDVIPGDRRRYFSLAANGKVFCSGETMSAYRHVTSGGSSYSANLKKDFERDRRWHEAALQYSYRIGKKEAISCAELMYILAIRSGILRKQISIRKSILEMKKIRHIWKALLLMCKRDIRYYVLKKEVHI